MYKYYHAKLTKSTHFSPFSVFFFTRDVGLVYYNKYTHIRLVRAEYGLVDKTKKREKETEESFSVPERPRTTRIRIINL